MAINPEDWNLAVANRPDPSTADPYNPMGYRSGPWRMDEATGRWINDPVYNSHFIDGMLGLSLGVLGASAIPALAGGAGSAGGVGGALPVGGSGVGGATIGPAAGSGALSTFSPGAGVLLPHGASVTGMGAGALAPATLAPGAGVLLPGGTAAASGSGGIFSRLGDMARDYFIDPATGRANIPNVIQGVGTGLGALHTLTNRPESGGGGGGMPPGWDTPLRPAPMQRTRNPDVPDYFTYGQSGGEHQFFRDNALPSTPSAEPITPPVASSGVVPGLGGLRIPEQNISRPRKFVSGGAVAGPGSGRSDDIEALLSDGEYVIDAESVALLGDGSLDEGARRLDEMRANLRKHKGQALSKGKFSPAAQEPQSYMEKSKGGRIRGDWIRRVVPGGREARRSAEDRAVDLETLQRMVEAYRKAKPEEPIEEPRLRIVKARGGVARLQRSVREIRELAKKHPLKKAEGGPVEQLLSFGKTLEAELHGGNRERVQQLAEQMSGFEPKLREHFAKGGPIHMGDPRHKWLSLLLDRPEITKETLGQMTNEELEAYRKWIESLRTLPPPSEQQ